MKTDTPKGLIPDPQAHALTLADMILKASEGYEVGTVRAHREQWAIVIAALKAYAVPSETRLSKPRAWMNAEGQISSLRGGGYVTPLYAEPQPSTATSNSVPSQEGIGQRDAAVSAPNEIHGAKVLTCELPGGGVVSQAIPSDKQETPHKFWTEQAARFDDIWPLIADLCRYRSYSAWLADECDRLTAEVKSLSSARGDTAAEDDTGRRLALAVEALQKLSESKALNAWGHMIVSDALKKSQYVNSPSSNGKS